MEDHVYDPLDDIRNQLKKTRRQLLPLWIKVFLWIFLVLGGFVVLGFLAGLFGTSFSLELYGLETTDPLNPIGLFLTVLFLIKVITAFGLWTEKDWAIQVAYFDAIVGICVCVVMMFVYPFLSLDNDFHFNIRLELIALIPYLIKMNQIKDEWKMARVSTL